MANAQSLAHGLQRRGADLVTGGTDNHLVLIDVTGYHLTGRQAEAALLDAGIVTNRNSVPRDPNGAWYTSGIRLGTPALTTLGMGTAQMDEIADMIVAVLTATEAETSATGSRSRARYRLDPAVAEGTERRAAELLTAHPLYPSVVLR